MSSSPTIKAALFDLDGTLLDSMWVWNRVDELFFERHGIEMPADYPASISGMSYMATAEYTRTRFALSKSAAEIAAEWTRDSAREYAEHVKLKPGSAEFLDKLRARGVRLCVVTASRRELYAPCLARNGILDSFEFVLTIDEAGGGSKLDGRIYRMAAERLGVEPGECMVFEDAREGILGAKRLGMQAYCVIDPHSTHGLDEIKSVADGWCEVITDLNI